jgi:hypothetical protein
MTHLLALALLLAPAEPADRPCVLVVVGAPGTPEYEIQFRKWAGQWKAAADKARAESIQIGLADEGGTLDRDRLKSALADKAKGAEPLWVVLIGHGSYDGKEAKFNLRGPDVSDLEFSSWLAPIRRPVAVIDCASASAPFLNRLSGPDRVVITATRSGSEQNFARFGEYLAEAIASPAADLDKDGQVSLLEAYLAASGRTADYYKTRSRLATEHALLDDNGDHLGTPADWFKGVRAVRKAKDGATPDGLRAHQLPLIPSDRERAIPPEVRQKRNQLELAIAALRDQKEKLPEDDYYARLEPLMLDLARLYKDLPAKPDGPGEARR